MSITNQFNSTRLIHLIKNELTTHKKIIFMTALTLVLILAMLPFALASSLATFFLILYIGGFIVTSYAFTDLHYPARANSYLMLPCSNLERFLCKWFITSIGYAVATLLFFNLFTLISSALHLFLFPRLLILQPVMWSAISKYVCLQSIFLLGAITFKRYSFIKTSLSLAIICFIMTMALFAGLWMIGEHATLIGPFKISTDTYRNTFHAVYYAFWPTLAIICCYLTYLKITNYELR